MGEDINEDYARDEMPLYGKHMPEAVENIIAGHTASINALREERDAAKAEAEKNAKAQKELEELQKKADGKDPFKVKYEAIKEEFEEFKKGIETEKTAAAKLKAYKDLLKTVGISEKRIDAVAKVADLDAIELNKDGSIKEAAKLSESLKAKDEIFEIKDTAERQRAMYENKELFI